MLASISVIVPAYHAAETIGETLKCIISQTRQPLEVIVVDDGSHDDTAAVARSYAGRIPGLVVITIVNGGVSRARNRGIAEASGEIIAPLDADDLWHPTYLEKMATRLERLGRDAALAYSFWRRVDRDGNVSDLNDIAAINGMGFYRLLAYNFIGNGSNYIFWRHRCLELGGFDETMPGCEDHNLQLRLAWTGSIGAVPERLVGYRDTPNSLSKKWRLMADYHVISVHDLKRRLPGVDAQAIRWALSDAHLHCHVVFKYKRAGTALESAWHFLLGAWYDPLRITFRLGAAAKSSLYRKIAELMGRAKPKPAPSFKGTHFLDVDPALNFPTVLPRFTRIRIRDSERLDHQRALELGMEAPAPSRITFEERLA